MTIGEQIRQKREERHLSQEELAEQIGVSRQAVSKWESGRSAPTGANLRALCQELSLELPEKPLMRLKLLCVISWCVTVVVLMVLVCGALQLRGAATPDGGYTEEAAVRSVRFYNTAQEEIITEDRWYNTAEIQSILLEWSGSAPVEMARVFFTPTGTNTLEETELLAVKTLADDSRNAWLLSADMLHRENLMGYLRVELHLAGGNTMVSDEYNVFYDPESLDASD